MASKPDKPKLIERWDTTLLSIFYAISGIAYLLILTISNFEILVALLLGLPSIIIAYGLFKTKKWAALLAIALFFPQIGFGIFSLVGGLALDTASQVLLFNIALIIHTILLMICFLYIAAKRKEFQL